jgi:hypothetical protein
MREMFYFVAYVRYSDTDKEVNSIFSTEGSSVCVWYPSVYCLSYIKKF